MSAFAKQIRPYVQAELTAAAEAERPGDHLRVHGHRLGFALRQGFAREALGQIPRLLLAAPLSLVGMIPTGNSGGSNVSGLQSMPVSADLQQIIEEARARAA